MAQTNNPNSKNTENVQNTNAQKIAGANGLRNALKEVLDMEGDYNNLLKDSIKSLNQQGKEYTKIAARLNSLNKDTINVKEVNRELLKLRQKEFIIQQNEKELTKTISAESQEMLRLLRQIRFV